MFSSDIFDAEVIDHEGEADGAGDVLPQARRVGYFVVSMWPKAFLQELVGEDACLWQSIDGLSYLHIYLPILGVCFQIVLDNCVLRK